MEKRKRGRSLAHDALITWIYTRQRELQRKTSPLIQLLYKKQSRHYPNADQLRIH